MDSPTAMKNSSAMPTFHSLLTVHAWIIPIGWRQCIAAILVETSPTQEKGDKRSVEFLIVCPLALIAGGEALDSAVDRILAAFTARPHIFNLGHGILPDTPIAHVEHLIARVRRHA